MTAGPVLALDLGTACGWALVEGDRAVRHGALDLEPGPHPGLRYLRLWQWLARERWPEGLAVAFEDVQRHQRRDKATGKQFVNTHAAHVYGGLRAIAEAWAAELRLPVLPVGVGSWKAAIGARGAHASKEEVWACIRMLGYAPATQDAADAIGVGLWAYRLRARQVIASAHVPRM